MEEIPIYIKIIGSSRFYYCIITNIMRKVLKCSKVYIYIYMYISL